RQGGAGARHVGLLVGAHLEATLRRARAEDRGVPGRPVVGEPRAVEAARRVRELERPHEALGDPDALERRQRRVAGHGLEAVAVLEATDRRREARPPEREEPELQERLALRTLLRARVV